MPLRRPRLAALALRCLLPLSLAACGAPKGDPALEEGEVNPGEGSDGASDGSADGASDGGSGAPIDEDGDGSPLGADCDDGDPARAPGAPDAVGDGVDQDCDGLDGVDRDRDGVASIESGGVDCDDSNPAINPSATDLLGDGIDQGCDGVDGTDVDGDGFASRASGGDDCEDLDPDVNPGALDAAGDGLDADCDGVDGVDADGDGEASVESGGPDCDDADPRVLSRDQDGDGHGACAGDCDDLDPGVGLIDGDGDGLLDSCGPPVDADRDGSARVDAGGADCDDRNPAINPSAADLVGDGVDQNCDGLDGTDRDGDGAASRASGGADCDDAAPDVNPGAADPTADGVDQDCDGVDGPPVVDPEDPGTCACGPDALAAALAAGPVDLQNGSTMGGAPLRTADDRLGWSMLDDVPADLADGDDDTLGALGCAADALAVATSGGGWACARLSDLRGCPADMVAVADACVELNERGTDNYLGAARACDALGRRLCRADELILACDLGLTADATDDLELTANLSVTNQYFFATGSPCTRTSNAVGSTGVYRCCMNP